MVTIAASGPWPGNPAPVTITSVPVVRGLHALNMLPYHADKRSLLLHLTYFPPPVARPAECGAVHLRLGGKDEPDLQPPGSYSATVLKIAGLRWRTPG